MLTEIYWQCDQIIKDSSVFPIKIQISSVHSKIYDQEDNWKDMSVNIPPNLGSYDIV